MFKTSTETDKVRVVLTGRQLTLARVALLQRLGRLKAQLNDPEPKGDLVHMQQSYDESLILVRHLGRAVGIEPYQGVG